MTFYTFINFRHSCHGYWSLYPIKANGQNSVYPQHIINTGHTYTTSHREERSTTKHNRTVSRQQTKTANERYICWHTWSHIWFNHKHIDPIYWIIPQTEKNTLSLLPSTPSPLKYPLPHHPITWPKLTQHTHTVPTTLTHIRPLTYSSHLPKFSHTRYIINFKYTRHNIYIEARKTQQYNYLKCLSYSDPAAEKSIENIFLCKHQYVSISSLSHSFTTCFGLMRPSSDVHPLTIRNPIQLFSERMLKYNIIDVSKIHS
jgi:hypothetical protein